MNFLRAGSCGAAADGSFGSSSSFAGARAGRRAFTRESSFIFEASLEHWPWAETCYVKFGPDAAGSMTKTLGRLGAAWQARVPRRGSGVECSVIEQGTTANRFFDTAEAPIKWLIAKFLRQVCHEEL